MNTIFATSNTVTEMIDQVETRQLDLRVFAFWALMALRDVSEDQWGWLVDAIEKRCQEVGDYADLKIWLNERNKDRRQNDPIRRMLRDMFGEEDPR